MVWYACTMLGLSCNGKALSGGKLCRTIGEGVFPLATVSEQVGVASKARE